MDEFGREEVNFIVAGLIGVFFFRFIRLRMIVVKKRTVVVFVFLLESSLLFSIRRRLLSLRRLVPGWSVVPSAAAAFKTRKL